MAASAVALSVTVLTAAAACVRRLWCRGRAPLGPDPEQQQHQGNGGGGEEAFASEYVHFPRFATNVSRRRRKRLRRWLRLSRAVAALGRAEAEAGGDWLRSPSLRLLRHDELDDGSRFRRWVAVLETSWDEVVLWRGGEKPGPADSWTDLGRRPGT